MRECKHCGFCGNDEEFSTRYDYLADGSKVLRVNNTCKRCASKRAWKYLKSTKKTDPCYYFACQSWKTLNQRCVNGRYAYSDAVLRSPQMISYHKKNIRIEITKSELEKFWRDNEQIVKDILSSGQTPTIDRINDNGHYSLDNMQILSRKANIQKSRGVAENPKPYDPETKSRENARRYREAQENNNEN